jgi:hypothetical protein
MGFVHRAFVAAGVGFAASAIVGCGSNGRLLNESEASHLTAELNSVSSALYEGRCTAAQSELTNFQGSLANLKGVNSTLVANLDQGASTIEQLTDAKCAAEYRPSHTTTTRTHTATTRTSTTPTTTTYTTPSTSTYTTSTYSTPTYSQPSTSTTGGSSPTGTTATTVTSTPATTPTNPSGGQGIGGSGGSTTTTSTVTTTGYSGGTSTGSSTTTTGSGF